VISFKHLGDYGRFGNQLFQVATTYALAKRNNDEYVLGEWEHAKHFRYPFNQKETHRIKTGNVYHEPQFHYKTIPYSRKLDLRGYFQSDKYFPDIDAKHLFAPSDAVSDYLRTIPDVSKFTAIHVRRGDYLELSEYHCLQEMDYYHEAMERIGGPFMIFSDDPKWCAENFEGCATSHESMIHDFFLMSRCKNKIIANSSFSWWAAYLGGGRVIAPSKWFGPACKHNWQDIYCKEWEII